MFRKILKNFGIYGYLVFGVLAGLFIVGEVSIDNNFWVVVAFVLGLTVPVAILVYMVLRGYESVRYIILIAAGVMVMCNIASGIWAQQWREWTFTNGPVLGIAAFAITIAAAVWARTSPLQAGLVMIVLGVVPIVVETASMGRMHLGGSTGALAVPAVLAGTMIVLSHLGEKSEIER